MNRVNPRPFIIPIFLPNMGCPHRCSFCNQNAITGIKQNIPSFDKLEKLVDQFLKYKRKNRGKVQISFYGGNFLGLKEKYITELLNNASVFVQQGKINSIRFSTRPDTINKKNLNLIKDYQVSTIELGVQSMDDQVLNASLRGHTSLDTNHAVRQLKEKKYETGMQMMVGLPGDDQFKAMETGKKIADLKPDFVRIYPTVVLQKSILAKLYKTGTYTPMSLEKSVDLVKSLYLLFAKKNIPVIRMGLQAEDDFTGDSTIIAGPYHPAFGHLVHSKIFLDKAVSILKNLKIEDSLHKNFSIKVHPKSISKIRGLNNNNIKILIEKFHIKSLDVLPDSRIAEQELKVEIL